jgi:hypothetical protein
VKDGAQSESQIAPRAFIFLLVVGCLFTRFFTFSYVIYFFKASNIQWGHIKWRYKPPGGFNWPFFFVSQQQQQLAPLSPLFAWAVCLFNYFPLKENKEETRKFFSGVVKPCNRIRARRLNRENECVTDRFRNDDVVVVVVARFFFRVFLTK